MGEGEMLGSLSCGPLFGAGCGSKGVVKALVRTLSYNRGKGYERAYTVNAHQLVGGIGYSRIL